MLTSALCPSTFAMLMPIVVIQRVVLCVTADQVMMVMDSTAPVRMLHNVTVHCNSLCVVAIQT